MSPTNEGMVPVCVTQNDVHELEVAGALSDAGIEFVTENFFDPAYGEIGGNLTGHSRILVFKHDVEKAKEVIGSE